MIEVLTETARAAGALLRKLQPVARARISKGDAGYATEADYRTQEIILKRLAAEFPGIPILAEEQADGDTVVPEPPFFVVDPLDGTSVYDRGSTLYGVLIAYVDQRGPETAVIFLPARNVLVTAERGRGCTLNGKPVRLDHKRPLRESLLACCVDGGRKEEVERALEPHATPDHPLFRLKTAAGTFVTLLKGRIGGYVNFHRATSIWDMAPGALAVAEAGGVALAPDGSPLLWDALRMNAVLAASESLARELIPLTREFHATLSQQTE